MMCIAEYEQKSDSLFAELTVTREALAAYNDASQSNENPINSRPENSNEVRRYPAGKHSGFLSAKIVCFKGTVFRP